MAYAQLKSPNLAAVGRIGWCLEYAARVFNTSHNEYSAWAAWGKVGQRTDAPPATVSYPLWFSYYLAGENLGHVVIYVPGQGYYSSPWKQGTNHAILPSIAEVERIYGVKYVGWSEDILNEQVIADQGGTYMVDENLLFNYYRYLLGRAPDDAGKKSFIGQPADVVFQELVLSAEYIAYQAKITNGEYVPVADQLFKKK